MAANPTTPTTIVETPKQGLGRNFWALWSAGSFANLADGIFKLALPLLALRLTNSPAVVAGVALAVRLPWLLFALAAGSLADRLNRKWMMIGAHIVRVLVLGAIVVALQTNTLTVPFLYGVALILGIAETLADTASGAVIPMLVPPEKYDAANVRLVSAMTITNEFMGPSLGGFLAALSISVAFGSSAGLYLIAGVVLLGMLGNFRPTAAPPKSIWHGMWEGINYVWQKPLLRALAIIVAVLNIAWSAWMTVIIVYLVAPGPGNITEVEYGLMLTTIGIGGVVGAMITEQFARWVGRRWAVAANIVGTFIMLGVPIFTANVWWVGAAAFVAGIASSIWNVLVSSLRQQATPEAMQGRVSGVFRLFAFGSFSVGAALAGIIAEQSTIPMVFVVVSIMNLLLFIPFFRTVYPNVK